MIRNINYRHPLVKVALALTTFLFIVAFGTAGYMVVEEFPFLDALYMTVITISTVGYTEVRELTSNGRVFTIVLIVLNLSLLTFFVSYITQYFLDGGFQEFFNRYKMNRSIQHLKDHVIICGYGRNGKEATRLLMKSKVPVVILEKHGPGAEEEMELRHYIHADATLDESLKFAGVDHASALITTLPDDADNLFIVLTARELNPALRIISRASRDTSIRKLKTAGANEVIMPDKIGGMHMANLVTNPDVKEFIDYMAAQESDTQITEVPVNRTLELGDLDCWNQTGALVLGLRDAGRSYFLNPSGTTVINSGDRLIVLGQKQQIEKVKALVS